MATVTIEALSSLVHDYIAAQAKRDAKREADYERQQKDYERQQAENERQREDSKLQQAENERQREDSKRQQEDFDKSWKQLQQEFDKIGISYDEQNEAIFVNLSLKFDRFGYNFTKESKGSIRFLDKDRRILADVDHLLENGSVIIPIEVKAKLKVDHIDDHVERLGKISRYNELHGDKRKVLGAVAGGIVPKNVLEYAHKKGLYVLVQNGDSVEVADTPPSFTLQEW